MLEIKNTERFATVVSDAIEKVAQTVKDDSAARRWVNAINKAASEIESHGEFMTYDETGNYLLVWSQGSDKVYSANGVCQCKAFTEFQSPCWHRAAAQLVRNYLGLAENKSPRFPAPEVTYLPPARVSTGRMKIGNVWID